MAAIDDKISELNFDVVTAQTPEHVARVAADAAEIASAGGEKTTLTPVSPRQIDGAVRNFVRVKHADFVITIDPVGPGQSRVRLTIGEYMRTRQSVLLIPVTPWMAPAYSTLKAFSDHFQRNL